MKLSIDLLFTRPGVKLPWALAGVLLLGLWATASARAESISDSALAQISALRAEKDSRTPAQKKMDSQLVYAYKQSLNQPVASGVGPLRLQLQQESDGRVWVDLKATITPELLAFIRSTNATVLNSFPEYNSARILIPLAFAETLAARPDVTFLRSAVPVTHATGSVDSQGDLTHAAFSSRPKFNTDGAGVSVGVLSDSVDYMGQAQSTDDLPDNLTVLPGQDGMPGSGEGTAMLEIVYDLAPGANLFFATGNGGPAAFARNIRNLRAAGCDIIIDDLIYADESPFQDGIVAQAVNTVTASGALYFSSAGNEGNLKDGTSGTWTGDFVDAGAAGTPVNGKNGNLHGFVAGGMTNSYDLITQPGGFVSLFWSDPLGGSTNDYDLFILDTNGQNVVSSSTTVQNGTQDPFEMVPGPNFNERLVVVKASGDPRFLHIENYRGQLSVATAGNIRGHNCATNAFAVAAVDVRTAFPNAFIGGPANPVEAFSSDGPRRMFYNADGSAITPTNFLATGGAVRMKPDIAAADGVVTTLPANSGLNPFFGTSAAAPHAGALAALLMSYNPSLTPSQIRDVMTNSALDIEGLGFDVNSGYGIVMADGGIGAAPAPAPMPDLQIVSSTISGGNGNGYIDYNECNNLDLVLTNIGRANASGVRVSLSTTTPGVIFAQANSPYPNISTNGSGTNVFSFQISTAPDFNCGSLINVTVLIKSDQLNVTRRLSLPTGTPGVPLRFDNSNYRTIPGGGSMSSFVQVTNILNALNKVQVSVNITSFFDDALVLKLIAPDGTTTTLSANHGGSGANYGIACSPDAFRTTFDDDAVTPIGAAVPPFTGSYKPDQRLSRFFGKSGQQINGLWQLVVSDTLPQSVGALNCWSLILTPTVCTNGGGECPGSDLALGMVAQPDPVIVGENLTYTLSVTNLGPSGATNVTVSQVLPPNAIPVSATASQGSCAFQSGVMTANLGPMHEESTATITVIVLPAAVGVVSSSASVTSEQNDFDHSNNNATVLSHVNPPTADVAVNLSAAPSTLTIGSRLTYTLTVTNNGPSAASGVTVTNVFPAGVVLLDQTVSQGSLSLVSSNVVVCNFGVLGRGGRAVATMSAIPVLEGTLVATAHVSMAPGLADPVVQNNTSAAPITVGPAADLGVSLTAVPNPLVLGSNVTFVTTVTNAGPSTATNVVVTQSLPPGVTVLDSSASQGVYSFSGSNVFWEVGTLAQGDTGSLSFLLRSTKLGTLSSVATIASAVNDPYRQNNSASVSAAVSTPFITIQAAGAALVAEGFSPPNGAVDPGETVTVEVRLQNTGNVPNTNLVVTLLPTGGVTAPSGPVTYGVLQPVGSSGGVPVGQNFTFKASGIPGGTVVATFQLQDGVHPLPPVSFTFQLPSVFSFANTAPISVPGAAYTLGVGPGQPYPSTLSVSGVTGPVSKVTATLSGLTHTYPHDISALLVGPTGAKTLLLSHAGAGSGATNLTITFDDTAAAPFGENDGLVSGSFQPSVYGTTIFSNPAPAGPYAATFAPFGGVNPNGTWSLYLLDDNQGDSGMIAQGWGLTFTTVTPVNQAADLGVKVVASPEPALVADNLMYTFTVTNAGPATATGVTFSNALPAGVTLVSASTSQGNLTTNGSVLIGNLSSINAGGFATIRVMVQPTPAAAGQLVNIATVSGFELDLHSGDNTCVATSTIKLPVAALALAMNSNAASTIVGTNVTFVMSVTNSGPGKAVNVVITDPLPAGAAYVASSASQGSVASNGTNVVATLGTLAPYTAASVTVVLVPSHAGLLTNTATVATASIDPTPADNAAAAVVAVVNPAPNVVVVATKLVSESFLPPNGAINPGETVTIGLGLANSGQLDVGNLTATLLASGGVTAPSAPANYGRLAAGGPAVIRPFTFTASPTATGTLTATLQLKDGAQDLGSITVTFNLPALVSLTSTNAIVIPDHGVATPYPAIISVSGLSGVVSKATVTLNGFSHSFPSDVSVLLVNPAGTGVVILSHEGGSYAATNLTLTFDDAAKATLAGNAQMTSGNYIPSVYTRSAKFPVPAAAPSANTNLQALAGVDPNGAWALYVVDDSTGDAGVISGGWSLNLTTVSPLTPPADLAVGISGDRGSLLLGDSVTYTMSVTNFGPSLAPGVVVTDNLPAGFGAVSNFSGQAQIVVANGVLTAQFGDVPAGSGASASFTVVPSQAGLFVNSVAVSGGFTDLNPDNNAAQVATSVTSPIAPSLYGQFGTNGAFELTVAGQPGLTYTLQASTNLTSWTAIGSYLSPFNGIYTLTDTNWASFQSRYYRAVRP